MNEADFTPLLKDLDEGAANDEFRLRLKLCALAEFRRARGLRRIVRLSAGLLMVLSAGVVLFWTVKPGRPFSRVTSQSVPVSPARPFEPAPMPEAPPLTPPVNMITPEQLMAAFPPGSCFLVELDGQMTLVFHDAAMRDEYVR